MDVKYDSSVQVRIGKDQWRGLENTQESEAGYDSPLDRALVIIGATSCGKTDIALRLAEQYDGEIINGWAMPQIAGYPLATTSYDVLDQERIPYHLYGILKPSDRALTVKQYKYQADKVVEDVLSRGKWPIFDMGNVNYFHPIYIDSLSDGSSYGKIVALRWDDGIDVSEIISHRLEKIIDKGLVEEVAAATKLGRENDYVLAHNLLAEPILQYLQNRCSLNIAKQKILKNALVLSDKINDLLAGYPNLPWLILAGHDINKNVESVKQILHIQ